MKTIRVRSERPSSKIGLWSAGLLALLIGCQSAPLKPAPGASQSAPATASAAASVASTTQAAPTAPAPSSPPGVIRLENGSSMQVARGWKKKDVGDRKLSEQIAKMHVFTANAGERILSVTEMKQDANKPCATMLDEQWARMEKSKKEAKNEVEGARYEDTKLGRRRVLFYAGKQFGLYGKEKGRPKSSTATLLTCDENTLIVVAHASKTAVKPSETRKLLWELTATLGPKTK